MVQPNESAQQGMNQGVYLTVDCTLSAFCASSYQCSAICIENENNLKYIIVALKRSSNRSSQRYAETNAGKNFKIYYEVVSA